MGLESVGVMGGHVSLEIVGTSESCGYDISNDERRLRRMLTTRTGGALVLLAGVSAVGVIHRGTGQRDGGDHRQLGIDVCG